MKLILKGTSQIQDLFSIPLKNKIFIHLIGKTLTDLERLLEIVKRIKLNLPPLLQENYQAWSTTIIKFKNFLNEVKILKVSTHKV